MGREMNFCAIYIEVPQKAKMPPTGIEPVIFASQTLGRSGLLSVVTSATRYHCAKEARIFKKRRIQIKYTF
jgi:hypothetical protein